MRKLTYLLFVLFLSGTLALAEAQTTPAGKSGSQTTTTQSPAGVRQQSNGTAQTPLTAPHTANGDRNASQVDRGANANQNSAASNQAPNAAPASTSPQTPVETPAAQQRATTNGGSGVPWGWIIIGIIVIAIILALIGRGGNERAAKRDRTVEPAEPDTEDDDIRRAS